MDLIEWVMAHSQDILQSLKHRDWRSGHGDKQTDRHRERERERERDRDDVADVRSGVWAEAEAAAAETEPVPEVETEAEAGKGTSSRVGMWGERGGGGLRRTAPSKDAMIDGGRPVVEWREDRVNIYLLSKHYLNPIYLYTYIYT